MSNEVAAVVIVVPFVLNVLMALVAEPPEPPGGHVGKLVSELRRLLA
jgi:hypothetical protein